MFHIQYLVYFIVLYDVVSVPQINLYYTDWISDSGNGSVAKHNCLRVAVKMEEAHVTRQIVSFCMDESPSNFAIEKSAVHSNFTFAQLLKMNISSEQLYLWSASIDIIERYQFYLNEVSTSKVLSSENEVYYNCSWPRFGPVCQYEFVHRNQHHSSFYEIIDHFYHTYKYEPASLTCYNHLKCNRGHPPACLDWSEICDGKVDCLNGEFDEEHCWQLEMNECEEDEYRCLNGQCIPKLFFLDDINVPDCLDRSDEPYSLILPSEMCPTDVPSFGCEDLTCGQSFMTNSCVKRRVFLLRKAMYSVKDNSTSDECWSAFKIVLSISDLGNSQFVSFDEDDKIVETILENCSAMLYIPTIPILFGDFYSAYYRNDSIALHVDRSISPFLCYNSSLYADVHDASSKVSFDDRTCFRAATLWTVLIYPVT